MALIKILARTDQFISITISSCYKDFDENRLQHNSPIDQNSNNEMKIDFLYEKPLKESRDLFETMYLKHHLSQNKSITELSKKTGIERTHLYRKLKQLGIKV